MATNIAMLVMGIIALPSGVAILLWPEPLGKFFKLLGDTMTMYPEKMRNAVYKTANLRIAGVGYVLFGVSAFAILVWRLTHGHEF